jgi:hypothetical protein
MKTQNFSNHVRKHWLFHYFIVPASLVLILVSIVYLFRQPGLGSVITVWLSVLLLTVAFIERDYAKKSQDRIIRTEMRLRYFILTGKSFEPVENKLSTGQLLALRFAEDDELLALLANTTLYNSDANTIKKQIKKWKPDYMRV